MQNVACPITIVSNPNGRPISRNALLRAMPVTMPGSAIGRRTRSEIVLRPKNRYRDTANAAIVPSSSAMAVAPSPAFTLVVSAARAPEECHALVHHVVVNPRGGQPNVRELLNELMTTTTRGT